VEMIRLRIFVTSRREYIVNRFKQIPTVICSELVLDSTVDGSTERDISTYLESELTKIAEDKNMGIWQGENNKKTREQLSGRLFIAAATACRFLRDTSVPDRKLRLLLASSNSARGSTRALDEMYLFVLRQAILESRDKR